MSVRVAHNVRLRRNFGKIRKIVDIPNLIEIQQRSYEEFLQLDVPPGERRDTGLQGVFKSVFPIKDFNETASLEFVSYTLGEPKYSVEECHERGMTYAAPLKVTIQLVIWDVDAETGARSIKNVKEQEVYFGEIPLMTDQRHLHDQRHRARHRQPAAPLARRLLRPRQGQDARQRQAAVLGAHHPVPRLVDRLRVRSARHPLRPHRPAPQVPRHGAAARPRDDHRGPAQLLLQDGHHPHRRQPARQGVQAGPAGRRQGDARHPRRRQRAHRQGRPQDHQGRPSSRWRPPG